MSFLHKVQDWYQNSALKYHYSRELPEDSIHGLWSMLLGFLWSTVVFYIPVLMIWLFLAGLNPHVLVNAIPEIVFMIPTMLWFMLMPVHVAVVGEISKNYYENTKDFPKRIHNYKDFKRLYDTKKGKRKG